MTVESKVEIRRAMLAQRLMLNEESIREYSKKIAARLETMISKNTVVAAYAPVKNEVDALGIIASLRLTQIALPCTVNNRKILTFRRWMPGDALETGLHNIPCPTHSEEVEPEILLIPLLAFDNQGLRLGYGGGYFDATLAALKKTNPKIKAIGLAYSFQQVDTLPSEPHDVKLDMVVTEQQIFNWY